MLEEDIKRQLAAAFAHLEVPIEIRAFLDDSNGTSLEVRALLADVASTSPRIHLTEVRAGGEGERRPSFSIGREGEEARVRFAGLPLGHELTSLVLAILHVGGHPPQEGAAALEHARALEGTFAFETYFSQSCQNCPDVVQALNVLAALNPGVTHTAIEGSAFQGEVAERTVMAVPAVFLNGEPFAHGRMELAEILSRIDAGAATRSAAELGGKAPFDVLIVGGGPAGAAGAIYAARKGIRTGMVTERFGGQVLDTLAIENFVSVSATEGPAFARALEAHVGDYDVDVMKHQRARRLVPGDLIAVELESGATLRARSVILATGARWRNMNVPGEQEYRNRGVTYCPHCDGPLFKGKPVAVIGGGNSGVEAAIDLAGLASHVTLVELGPELRADEVLTRRLRSLPNVEVRTSARVTEVVGDGSRVTHLEVEDLASGDARELAVDGVFVQIGLLPNTEWLAGAIELSRTGEIVIDDHGRTSVPGVFAAGDATTTPFKQIIIATGDGARAALGAFEHLIRRPTERAA